MARAPDPRIEQAKVMYLNGARLVEIAASLNLPEGTVRRWKCTHRWDSERSDKKSERSEKKKRVTFKPASDLSGVSRGSRRVTTELDIRGMSVLEADGLIDEFIDSAALAGLNQVSIIHGKGTGVLREAVHEKLRGMKQVDSFRVGVFGEGESGVTIVTLK